ncbi:MAG: glycosyltransferase family 9 protein [bacterium]
MAGFLEQAGRRLLTQVTARLLPARDEVDFEWTLSPPQRVLFVRHDDRIGNLVLLTPLLQGARQLWPGAEIGVLVGPRYADLYRDQVFVDAIWVLEKRRILRNPARFFRLLKRLRAHDYDMAFDCSHMHSFSLTGAALTYFSAAPLRVAYERGAAGDFANLLVEPLHAEHHESDILLNLLRPFADRLPSPPMRLHTTKEARWNAEMLFAARDIPEDAVVLGVHVGGRGAKRWPVERWLEVLRRVTDLLDVRVAVFCGPEEAEMAGTLAGETGREVTVFEALGLETLAAAVERCHVFLAPDTGPMHMAVALEVPTVAVFLEDTWKRYGPRGSEHRIVRADPGGGEDEVVSALTEVFRQRFGGAA